MTTPTPQQHVMLDLETFGTGPNAAIVQIGACTFGLSPEEQEYRGAFKATVSLQSSIIVAGGSVEQATIEWWLQQSRSAQWSIVKDAKPIAEALQDFRRWFPEDAVLWSHGASFDIPILESAYRATGFQQPWSYRAPRDTRTLYWLARTFCGWSEAEWDKNAVQHDALVDAIHQAQDVRSAFHALSLLAAGKVLDKASSPPPGFLTTPRKVGGTCINDKGEVGKWHHTTTGGWACVAEKAR